MVREFTLPDVGEGLTEAEIVEWLVEAGDAVSEDQPVAEVETDKAVVEVPSPVNGTVRELHAEVGEMVPVGEVIVSFDTDEETSSSSQPPADDVEGEPVEAESEGGEAEPGTADAVGDEVESAVSAVTEADDGDEDKDKTPDGRVFAAPSARRLGRELGVELASVEGSGPGGRVTEGDVRAHAEAESEEPEPAVASATAEVAEAERTEGTTAATVSTESADRDRTLAAPATRKLAAEEGVDIDTVPTDERRDGEPFVAPERVTEYAETQRAAQEADAEAVADAAGAGSEAADPGEGDADRVPYRGIRRTIGEAMVRSKDAAPHVTHHEEVVVSSLVETRERLRPAAEARGSRLTYMPFVVKAVVAALEEHPILNSQLDEESEEILLRDEYNVGVAVATDAGLMVPVVEGADAKGLLELADEIDELAGKARERTIEPEEMRGGTFSITNFGAIGGEYATPILNHPEAAILGLGALEQRPVVEDTGASETPRASGEVVARHTLPLSLSIDHRIVDGADAARFVNTLSGYLENPELLLL